jgi:hypothetical protein
VRMPGGCVELGGIYIYKCKALSMRVVSNWPSFIEMVISRKLIWLDQS